MRHLFARTPAISASFECLPSAATTSGASSSMGGPSFGSISAPTTLFPSFFSALTVCPRRRSTPGVPAAWLRTIGSSVCRRTLTAGTSTRSRIQPKRVHSSTSLRTPPAASIFWRSPSRSIVFTAEDWMKCVHAFL